MPTLKLLPVCSAHVFFCVWKATKSTDSSFYGATETSERGGWGCVRATAPPSLCSPRCVHATPFPPLQHLAPLTLRCHWRKEANGRACKYTVCRFKQAPCQVIQSHLVMAVLTGQGCLIVMTSYRYKWCSISQCKRKTGGNWFHHSFIQGIANCINCTIKAG